MVNQWQFYLANRADGRLKLQLKLRMFKSIAGQCGTFIRIFKCSDEMEIEPSENRTHDSKPSLLQINETTKPESNLMKRFSA